MDTVKDVTVYPTPFVKPHCVLIVADATVLLINKIGRASCRERV